MANTDWKSFKDAFESAYDKSVQSQQRRYDREQQEYDKSVEAQERMDAKLQQSINNEYREKQFRSQKEQNAINNNKKERELLIQEKNAEQILYNEKRNKFYQELDMIKNPSQKYEYAKNNGIEDGYVSDEFLNNLEETSLNHGSFIDLRKRFYNANNEERLKIIGPLKEQALLAGIPAAQINSFETSAEKARISVGRNQSLEIIKSAYPDIFPESILQSISEKGMLTEDGYNMAVSLIENNIKDKNLNSKQKLEMAKSLMAMKTNEMDSQDRKNMISGMNALGLKWMTEINKGELSSEEEENEVEIEKPTLSSLDERITGQDGTFDKMNEERKESIFNQVIQKHASEWGSMGRDDKRRVGQKIIDEINNTEYDLPVSIAGIGGTQITDPKYKGSESITDNEIESKYRELLEKRGITTKEREKFLTKNEKEKLRKKAKDILVKEIQKESKKKAKSLSKQIKEEQFRRSGYTGRRDW